jgi:hypothetical protein
VSLPGRSSLPAGTITLTVAEARLTASGCSQCLGLRQSDRSTTDCPYWPEAVATLVPGSVPIVGAGVDRTGTWRYVS